MNTMCNIAHTMIVSVIFLVVDILIVIVDYETFFNPPRDMSELNILLIRLVMIAVTTVLILWNNLFVILARRH